MKKIPSNVKVLLKLIGFILLGVILLGIGAFIIYKVINKEYRFYNQNNIILEEKVYADPKTVIEFDKKYEKIIINSKEDANSLIAKESNKQKDNKKCSNNEIKDIEAEIENKYSVYANLCELDIKTANYLKNLLNYINTNYPKIIGYMSNLSLSNVNLNNNNYIASFVPAFTFAKADTKTSFPFIMKTELLLNSKYYLNETDLKYTIANASGSGYFVKNADGYSIIAHEMGHFLSFALLLKNKNIPDNMYITYENYNNYYAALEDYAENKLAKKIVSEAYNSYVNKVSANYRIEDFKNNISSFANAKNSWGEYNYDETIAEAFHDIYVNKNNASKESIAVINTLNKYLK